MIGADGIEREEMDCDVLIVGGGSAGLSAAYHLQELIEQHNQALAAGEKQGEPIDEPMIVVLEKGPEIGAHSFSGAVMNPVSLREMIPDYSEKDCPLEAEVKDEEFVFLTKSSKLTSPFIPPPFHNRGNFIVSISKFNRWLGEQAEAKGANIFPGFAAVEALYEGDRVVGVRTGDKGLDKNGQPKSNFEPGMLIKAKVTIFAEGPRGSLFKQVAQKLGLWEGKNNEVFEEGVKEVIRLPAGRISPGKVIHTLGFPSGKTIGGSFIYSLPENHVAVGYVGYMCTEDPLFDPHRDLQRLKAHPFMQDLLAGGQVVAYGGKTIPGGGWYSMPKLYHDGMMVIGDSAGMVDIQKLKGIHLGMKAGMLAAKTALEAMIKNDFSAEVLKQFAGRINSSFVKRELYKVRNFHQGLSRGMFAGLPHLALQEITGGRGLVDNESMAKDREHTEPAVDVWGPNALEAEDNRLPKPDGKLFFSKLDSVFLTGTTHDEDSPNHLLVPDTDICRETCEPKYKAPCNHFCPAHVYEMVEDGPTAKNLQINYTNCIHCKSCDIKCPFDNITWTAPEGGGGPKYTLT